MLSDSIQAVGNEAVDHPDNFMPDIPESLIGNAGDDNGYFLQVDGARVGIKGDVVSFPELRSPHDNFFSALATLPGYIGNAGFFFGDGDKCGMRRDAPLL